MDDAGADGVPPSRLRPRGCRCHARPRYHSRLLGASRRYLGSAIGSSRGCAPAIMSSNKPLGSMHHRFANSVRCAPRAAPPYGLHPLARRAPRAPNNLCPTVSVPRPTIGPLAPRSLPECPALTQPRPLARRRSVLATPGRGRTGGLPARLSGHSAAGRGLLEQPQPRPSPVAARGPSARRQPFTGARGLRLRVYSRAAHARARAARARPLGDPAIVPRLEVRRDGQPRGGPGPA
jgi:hypothetical protein